MLIKLRDGDAIDPGAIFAVRYGEPRENLCGEDIGPRVIVDFAMGSHSNSVIIWFDDAAGARAYQARLIDEVNASAGRPRIKSPVRLKDGEPAPPSGLDDIIASFSVPESDDDELTDEEATQLLVEAVADLEKRGRDHILIGVDFTADHWSPRPPAEPEPAKEETCRDRESLL